MADFIDFNAWRDLAGQSEKDALERQTADFQKKNAEAQRLLRKANSDTENAQIRELGGANQFAADATGMASTTLSKVGSYGDYLKAKQSAQNAALRIGSGGGGEFGDVRGVMNQQGAYSANSVGELGRLGALEQKLGAERDRGVSEGNAGAERMRGFERSKRSAAEARAHEDEANRQRFDADIVRRMREAWTKQDAYRKGNQPFNPFRGGTNGMGTDAGQTNPFNFNRGELSPDQMAMIGKDAYWGLEDNQRLAQMARQSGLDKDADRFQSTPTYDALGNRLKGGY